MRKIVTFVLLPVIALSLMGFTTKCGAAGQAPAANPPPEPQPSVDPEPNAPRSPKPEDRTYNFRIAFSTSPPRTVFYTYRFGSRGDNDLEFDGDGLFFEGRVSPGETVRLELSMNADDATLTCSIQYVDDKNPKNDIRNRITQIYHKRPGVCTIKWVAKEGEEKIPSLQ